LIDTSSLLAPPLAAASSSKEHEQWACSLGRKTLALHDRMVACWLLNTHVWKDRQLKQGNIMSVVSARVTKWARRDPRRLLGTDDMAALFYRLLVLCNSAEQLQADKDGGGVGSCAEGVESDVAQAVCMQLLDPSLCLAQGFDGKLFVRQSLQALARLVLAARAGVRLAGLKLIGQIMVTWGAAGRFAVLADVLGDSRLDWPGLILALMHDAQADHQVLGLSLSTLATFLSYAPVFSLSLSTFTLASMLSHLLSISAGFICGCK